MANLCVHALRGSTLIEVKFVYKKGSKNPYDLGPWLNTEHAFGCKFGVGWFLPLPNEADPGRNKAGFALMRTMGFRNYEMNRELDQIGLTFYPISWSYVEYARNKIRTMV